MNCKNPSFHRKLIVVDRIAYERTRNLLSKHKDDVEKVAQLLLTKEVITRSAFSLESLLFPFDDRICILVRI